MSNLPKKLATKDFLELLTVAVNTLCMNLYFITSQLDLCMKQDFRKLGYSFTCHSVNKPFKAA